METVVKPYSTKGEKKEQVAEMFNNIAHRYDFLNHFFSLGIDKTWRRKALGAVLEKKPARVLDVATGTADFAIRLAQLDSNIAITGADISQRMLDVGMRKIRQGKLTSRIELVLADSEKMPFVESAFDVVTVGFGVRNFQNLEIGLKEIHRVLRPGGMIVVLEFSKPRKFPIKQLFRFYFFRVVPLIGRLVSKDARAYTYLPESVDAFPDGDQFLAIMRHCGFSETKCRRFTGGIASLYTALK